MSHKIKIGYCSGTGTIAPFQSLGGLDTVCLNHSRNIEKENIGLLILWGGEDISPSLYNQTISESEADETPSKRDMFEWEMLRMAVARNIPIIGVCRGAQLVTAFAGGSLIQHVNGHNGHHQLRTTDGREFISNSAHHQMMNPYNLPKGDYQVLAWTNPPKATTYVGEFHKQVVLDNGELFSQYPEPEVVYYKKINALCIQGHPEWMPATHDFVIYCVEQAKQLLLKEEPALV